MVSDWPCWVKNHVAEPLRISTPVAIAILRRSPYGNDRSDWRKSDWPSQLGHVFYLIGKSLVCQNSFLWGKFLLWAVTWGTNILTLLANSERSVQITSPDLVVINVTIVLFPSLQSSREMASHWSWMSVDPYLWKSFLPGKMNISSSLLKDLPAGTVSFHHCPSLNGLQCSNQPLVGCTSIYIKPTVEQAHIFHLSATWSLFSQVWWFRKYLVHDG